MFVTINVRVKRPAAETAERPETTENPRVVFFIYQKRPENIAAMNRKKSRNRYSKRVVAYYEVFNNKCTPGIAETAETPETTENPRSIFF